METWIPRILQNDGMLPMCEAPTYAKFCTQYVKLADHEQALAEKEREIQQIREHEYQRGYQEGEAVMLAQAVRFATYLRETIDSSDIGGLGMYEQVQAFLKEHP